MNILVKCMNSSNDKTFFKLITDKDVGKPPLDSFIYNCRSKNNSIDEDNILVELIYPDHTELYLEYNLNFSR